MAQLKGRLTTQRYRVVTLFIDHFLRLKYAHFQTDATSAETLKAKKAIEAFALLYGHTVKHYHCDNGRFADNAWLNFVEQSHQTISFCGVNAHHQNGIVEKAIHDL